MKSLNITDIIGWNDSANNYQVSAPVTMQENCFAYMATNIGDTIVTVQGKRLFPSATPATEAGDSVSMSDPLGRLYQGQLKVQFDLGGAAPNVEIIQMYYLTSKTING